MHIILQGLLGAHDVTRCLHSLLPASWHKLHGGSWSPDHHPADKKVLKFVSPKQRKEAAHDALYRYGRIEAFINFLSVCCKYVGTENANNCGSNVSP